jgi:hypothetical protein
MQEQTRNGGNGRGFGGLESLDLNGTDVVIEEPCPGRNHMRWARNLLLLLPTAQIVPTGRRADMPVLPGERSKDSPYLLQRQGLQEAHPAQGHTIQGRQGMCCTAQCLQWSAADTIARPPHTPKESEDTIVSSPVTVVRRSPFSIRRRRLPRRLCYAWNAHNARPRHSSRSSDASTSSWGMHQCQ